jgi:hypothetical protein
VLAIELQNLMAEVVILTVKAALRGDVRVQSGVPFAALNDDGRVRDQRVATDMVEMQMRSDDQFDAAGIAAEHGKACGNFFAGMVIEAEQAGYSRADPPGGIVLAGGVHAGIEQRRALWMLDQIGRDRQLRFPFPALHQSVEVAGQPAAGHRVKLDAHDLPPHPSETR